MTPTRTVYVKKEDEVVWEQAQALAGRSLSALISELLAEWVIRLHYLEPKVMKVIERLKNEGIEETFIRGLLQHELRRDLDSESVAALSRTVYTIHKNPASRKAWRPMGVPVKALGQATIKRRRGAKAK